MSTFKPEYNEHNAAGKRFAIVTADWNSHITHALRDGAIDTFRRAGVAETDFDTYSVPGAVELTYAASRLVAANAYDAVIVIGCVIRGDTPHFDYVCQSVTAGVTELNARGLCPVIFGVLTVDNEQSALDRAGGRVGNKGAEAADTAVVMANFKPKR